MKIAIVGVSGLVGKVMQEVLDRSKIKVDELVPIASAKSVGKKMEFQGKEYSIMSIQDGVNAKANIALFSAGGGVSKEWAPKFAEKGTVVIDNSSAWRMDPNKKLVVPEINAKLLTKEDKIIANPNCSTIQLVTAITEIHKKYVIKRMVISTYQSFTGTGAQAVTQYEEEKAGITAINPAYPHPIFANCIPHCDIFLQNDYTKEEMKLVHETRKILGDDSIAITATAVRVPVFGGHSEAVNIELDKEFNIAEIKNVLNNTPGVILQDDIKNNQYPTPLEAHDKDEVFVGRVRRDDSIKNGLNLWIVSDNLRKGAATNAIQIAEYINDNNILES